MKQRVNRQALIALGLLLFALLLIESAVGARGLERGQSLKTGTTSRVDDLFRSNCARCHGADGRSDTPLGRTYNAPDFTDAEWWRKHSDITSTGSLISIVRRGKGGMPAFGKKLSRGNIKLLVNYVRRFRDPKP